MHAKDSENTRTACEPESIRVVSSSRGLVCFFSRIIHKHPSHGVISALLESCAQRETAGKAICIMILSLFRHRERFAVSWTVSRQIT